MNISTIILILLSILCASFFIGHINAEKQIAHFSGVLTPPENVRGKIHELMRKTGRDPATETMPEAVIFFEAWFNTGGFFSPCIPLEWDTARSQYRYSITAFDEESREQRTDKYFVQTGIQQRNRIPISYWAARCMKQLMEAVNERKKARIVTVKMALQEDVKENGFVDEYAKTLEIASVNSETLARSEESNIWINA